MHSQSKPIATLIFLVFVLISCGKITDSNASSQIYAMTDGQSNLSGSCLEAIDGRAKVITLFLSSVSSIQRQRNEELAKQGQPHCGADLITSYSQTTEAPKGTVDLSVTTPSSSSQSSFSYPSISSLGSSSSGSSTAGSSFSIVLKASLIFPLGSGSSLICKNIYDVPSLVDAAIRLADSPTFQTQLAQACAN